LNPTPPPPRERFSTSVFLSSLVQFLVPPSFSAQRSKCSLTPSCGGFLSFCSGYCLFPRCRFSLTHTFPKNNFLFVPRFAKVAFFWVSHGVVFPGCVFLVCLVFPKGSLSQPPTLRGLFFHHQILAFPFLSKSGVPPLNPLTRFKFSPLGPFPRFLPFLLRKIARFFFFFCFFERVFSSSLQNGRPAFFFVFQRSGFFCCPPVLVIFFIPPSPVSFFCPFSPFSFPSPFFSCPSSPRFFPECVTSPR